VAISPRSHSPPGRVRAQDEDEVNRPLKENEIRRLLSKAWSRRRRKASTPIVQNARHLDLNDEFAERRGGGIKYFFLILVLLTLLVYAVSRMIGLEV
jgi:hypothetical protein